LATFALVLAFGEHQPHRGRFRNRQVLSALLGRRARWISFLMDHGDLIEQDKKVLYVDGWDEWQEGDWKVAERMKRVRDRQRRAKAVTATDTVSVTPPVTVPTVSGLSELQAVGGRQKATSEHGDAVVHDQANGTAAKPAPTEVQHVKGWLFGKRGWNDVTRDTHLREEAIAKQILSLGATWSDLQQQLDVMWDETDPDDRPSSLAYFWTRLQDEAHARIKQQPPSHARTDEGPTRISPKAPARSAK
jgi:hypothetical protein